MTTRSTPSAALTSPGYLVPFITVTALFFIFGFITNLNMALVPHLRSIFDLQYGQAMLAESAFFLAYLVFSAPTSKLIETIGYKRTMVVSLLIQMVGCLLFVPAARLVSFPLFLSAVFVVGAGVTVRFYPGPRGERFDSAEPGTGAQLHWRNHRADHRRCVHPYRSRQNGNPGGHRTHGARTVHCHCRRVDDPGSCRGAFTPAADC